MIYIHIVVLQLMISLSPGLTLYNEIMKITLLIIAFILWKIKQKKLAKKAK